MRSFISGGFNICRAIIRTSRLVTGIAVLRQRGEFALLVVTGETSGVRQRPRLKSSFRQPVRIAEILRRFGDKFIVRLSLWLMKLMTVGAGRIGVFVVRKGDAEIGNKIAPLRCCEKCLAETRKRIPRSINGRRLHMTI